MHPLELRKQLLILDRRTSDDDDYINRLDEFVGDKCWNGNPNYMKSWLGYFKGREEMRN